MIFWELINIAPKDGTEIDLWIVATYPRRKKNRIVGRRLTECFWETMPYGGGRWSRYGSFAHESCEAFGFFTDCCEVATHWTAINSPATEACCASAKTEIECV